MPLDVTGDRESYLLSDVGGHPTLPRVFFNNNVREISRTGRAVHRREAVTASFRLHVLTVIFSYAIQSSSCFPSSVSKTSFSNKWRCI